MSWVVEQSENTSAVTVNGNSVSCSSQGYYGSPVNVLYKDPASQNGQYYWIVEVPQLAENGGISVGLTTDQGFQAGWGLKAMKYLGNLSDGGALLVASFGEQIKQQDKVGLLLQLTDAELKFYIFLNDQPLGLAFNVQAPYPKPLYPVVSFNANGQAIITRSQQIPTSLNRGAAQFSGIEGSWEITNNAQNPETVGVQLNIKKHDQNAYRLNAKVVNNLNCTLNYNSSNNQCQASPLASTMMAGPPQQMQKEAVVSDLITNIQSLQPQGDQQLLLQTQNGQQVQFQRAVVPPPSAVTQNIFN